MSIKNGLDISTVSKESDITYSHCVNLVNDLESENIVKTKIDGRRRVLTLTKKGAEIQTNLLKVKHYESI